MYLVLRWIISALSIIISAYIITGVTVTNFWSALWISFFLGLVNATLKPILIILTLPANILTLGLFTFVINAFMVLFTSSVIKGFDVDGFMYALLFSVVVSVISFCLNQILGTKK